MGKASISSKSSWAEVYQKVNQLLAVGEEVYFNHDDRSFIFSVFQNIKGGKLLYYPKVGIYMGDGASHSWLWFVEFLEKIGLLDVYFINEEDIFEGKLNQVDFFLVGGGDTYAIAEALGEDGASRLKQFIDNGGGYYGSCAGAYLLLHLSCPPFIPFSNFTKIKMANVSKILPQCRCLPTKFFSPYNSEYVIHPVRETVALKPVEGKLLQSFVKIFAPLYGGPSMIASEEETVLANYAHFTEDTIFLGEKELAQKMFIGKGAVITKNLGKGAIWLFGPHFEHPQYPLANRVMADCMYLSMNQEKSWDPISFAEGNGIDDKFVKSIFKTWKRELSNARIIALSLESREIYWVIGKKTYEPEKIRLFLEMIWKRMPLVVKGGNFQGDQSDFEELCEMFSGITKDIKALVLSLQHGDETTQIAEQLFSKLKRTAANFFKIYFRNQYSHITKQTRSNLT